MFPFVLASEILAGAGAGISTLYVGLSRARVKSRLSISPSPDEAKAVRLQSEFGYNEHSFIGLAVQPEVWIDPYGKGVVSYNESGRVWVVGGEPLGRDCDLADMTSRFIREARQKKKVVAFLPTTEKFANAVAKQNVRIVKVGASPYFDLTKWNPTGNCAKTLRSSVNRGRRAGLSVTEITDITESFRKETNELCDDWGAGRRSGVKFGWLFAVLPFQSSKVKKYFAARDAAGKLVGVLAASPIPAREGWYLEDVVRAHNAPDGTSDLLVFEALKALAAQGAKLATLGTVPLSEKGEDELSVGSNYLVEKAFSISRRHLRSLYNFEGLGHFKSKFVPTWWENEYVIISKGNLVPPRVANAIFNILLPGGILKLLTIMFSDFS